MKKSAMEFTDKIEHLRIYPRNGPDGIPFYLLTFFHQDRSRSLTVTKIIADLEISDGPISKSSLRQMRESFDPKEFRERSVTKMISETLRWEHYHRLQFAERANINEIGYVMGLARIHPAGWNVKDFIIGRYPWLLKKGDGRSGVRT